MKCGLVSASADRSPTETRKLWEVTGHGTRVTVLWGIDN